MQTPHKASCRDFASVQHFKDGELDAKNVATKYPDGLQCIRIVIGPKQRTWAAISEIAVFTTQDQGASEMRKDSKSDNNKEIIGKLDDESVFDKIINRKNSLTLSKSSKKDILDLTTKSEVKITEIKDNSKNNKKKLSLEKLLKEEEKNKLKSLRLTNKG